MMAQLPPDIVRATVSHHQAQPFAFLLNTGPHDPPPVAPQLFTLEDRIQALPPEKKWSIDHISFPDGTEHIAQAIQTNHCFAVTDASLKHFTGASAFTIVGTTDLGRITAVNTVPGPINDGDSYRCELSGIYGILVLVSLLCEHHIIHHGAVHVRCDNLSSLRVFDSWFIPDPSDSSFDLTNSIWHLIKASPLTWTAEHVFGHQDNASTSWTASPSSTAKLMHSPTPTEPT